MRPGIGLRACHHADILARRPDVGFLEAHAENYFAPGGAHRRAIEHLRSDYPVSLHGVGLSIGSTDPLSRSHLEQLARSVREIDPMLISEHLCWSSVGGRFTNDLLPLPYTEEALRNMAARVREVQDFLGRQILIENVSSYLQFTCSQMSEWEFLSALVREAGCALLLDVNNIYVNAMNHGFDAQEYLQGIPQHAVREMHLAGHTISRIDEREIRIDTHSTPVCNEVWALYGSAVKRFGAVSTLIEWDQDIPALEVLVAEAHKAEQIVKEHHAAAA